MGSTFSNLHVRLGRRERVLAGDEVAGAMSELAHGQGMVDAAGDETADREVLVAGVGDWLSVYDRAFEPNQEELDRTAKAISSRLRVEVVTVLVYDSDILELRLFRDGELEDQYHSNPGYFGKVTKAARASARGQPSKWKSLLVPGASVEALRTAWAARPVFAEQIMQMTAPILGLPLDKALAGFEDIVEEGRFDRRLRWRSRLQARAEPLGPPRFDMAAGPLPQGIELSVGFEMPLSLGASSQGSASRGVLVVTWGEALDRGLVAMDSIELMGATRKTLQTMPEPAIDRALHHGAPARIARFPDFEIPAARPDALRSMDIKKGMEISLTTRVHSHIRLRGAAAGSGLLFASMMPVAAPHGECSWRVPIQVSSAPRVPLHARPCVQDFELRPLERRDMLFGLVSMDLDRVSAAKAAASLIERWGALLTPTGKLSIRVDPAGGAARPRGMSVRMAGFFAGQRWANLRKDLGTASAVAGRRSDEIAKPVAMPYRFGDGFFFGGTPVSLAFPEDPEVPTLGLWLDVAEAPEARIAQARVLSESLLDEAMSEHRGMQAMTGRWGWAPQFEPYLTPYERACGMTGKSTVLGHARLTRYLRGVLVGTLWLGPELTARVPDLDAVRAVCPTRSIGSGLRIDVPDAAALDPLEATLEPLLPRGDAIPPSLFAST
jgi:hypothetical protein